MYSISNKYFCIPEGKRIIQEVMKDHPAKAHENEQESPKDSILMNETYKT